MTGLAAHIGLVRAVLLVAAGVLLVGAALIAPRVSRAERPVWRVRPATEVEDRRWQLDRLSEAICEARRRDGLPCGVAS